MSINPSETNTVSESALERKFVKSLSLKDKDTEFVKGDLEEFAERLGIKEFTENKEEWKKFYVAFGPDFAWPPTMEVGERREVFDFIIDPEWEPTGEELARNTVEYRRLLESKTLDASQGSHILIRNGKLVSYGDEITQEEEDELEKKYPGCFYAPVVERTVVIRKFSANDDRTRKEWQSLICIQNVLNSGDEVEMASTEQNYRMVIDTGSMITVIPHSLRQQLYDPKDGWKNLSIRPAGYGAKAKINQASREWLIRLGDGTNWSNWIRTREVYSWQKNPPGVDCGIIGYDVLNNIPHYKPCRQPYVFLKNDIFGQIPQLQGSE